MSWIDWIGHITLTIVAGCTCVAVACGAAALAKVTINFVKARR